MVRSPVCRVRDQVELDRLAGQPVELAVVRVRARAPEAGTADIGQPRTEVVAKQAEQPEHHIAVGSGVGHDLRRLQLGLLFQHHGQQYQAVAQSARHGDGLEAGELVGDQVVPGDARPLPKYFGLGPACTVHTGTTKRMPSAKATSPHPRPEPAPVGFAHPPEWR